MEICKVCGQTSVNVLLDFGPQPLCNRFLDIAEGDEARHPLVLGQCSECGLMQLTQAVPPEDILPKFSWLKYNEPEGHLDELTDVLCGLSGLPENPVACGITYKDDSLLHRLKNGGFKDTWRIDPKADLGISLERVAGETVIPRICIESVLELRDRYGEADLIIARHVLEHTSDPRGFLQSISHLLRPGGYIVFEVPDCSLQLDTLDYSMLWEEHVLYFVPSTLRHTFEHSEYELRHFVKYPYPIENALIAIVQKKDHGSGSSNGASVDHLLDAGRRYAEGFPACRARVRSQLESFRQNNDTKVAIFGAGHLSCMYINLLEVGDCIDFVVDDDPHKQAMFMPGSSLPIKGSKALVEEDVGLCLLSLSPQSEAKVVARNKAFLDGGGRFESIFPSRGGLGNEEVQFATDPIVEVAAADIDALKERVEREKRVRIRLCAHRDHEDDIQEMLIAHRKECYVQPHKHSNRSESLHIVEGIVDVVLFDETGEVRGVIPMGDYQSDRRFFYRLPPAVFHSLVTRSDFLVFHEIAAGPFRRSDTVWASWAPEETDSEAVSAYLRTIDLKLIRYGSKNGQ